MEEAAAEEEEEEEEEEEKRGVRMKTRCVETYTERGQSTDLTTGKRTRSS